MDGEWYMAHCLRVVFGDRAISLLSLSFILRWSILFPEDIPEVAMWDIFQYS